MVGHMPKRYKLGKMQKAYTLYAFLDNKHILIYDTFKGDDSLCVKSADH